jgi:hypothetical protein
LVAIGSVDELLVDLRVTWDHDFIEANPPSSGIAAPLSNPGLAQ